MAVESMGRGGRPPLGGVVARVAKAPPADTVAALSGHLQPAVAAAWERGWQPADLHRFIDRQVGPDAARVLREALADDASTYAELGGRAAPVWMAQLDDLGLVPGRGDLGAALHRIGPTWTDALHLAFLLLGTLRALPTIPRLTDPPSAWVEGSRSPSGDVPAGLLAKIRALLAKAESTTFDAEAEAYTAKAQELMARHRIDRALLADAGPAQDADVRGRRIGIEDPYATAKFLLLSGIAEANGARAVWSKDLGSATVLGFPVELAIIEELFTSLLVQATAAMRREGSKQDAYGRSRTKAFRRSFLVAYADRVTDRLRHSVEDIVTAVATETGTDLVPILAARDDAVEARVDEVFPRLRSMSPSVSDAEGLYAGRLAADRADLSAGPPIERSA